MIDQGDRVSFSFHNGDQLYGKILSVPSVVGGLIELQTYHEGKELLIAYVKDFEYVSVMEKAL
jgi:hypothetical protein